MLNVIFYLFLCYLAPFWLLFFILKSFVFVFFGLILMVVLVLCLFWASFLSVSSYIEEESIYLRFAFFTLLLFCFCFSFIFYKGIYFLLVFFSWILQNSCMCMIFASNYFLFCALTLNFRWQKKIIEDLPFRLRTGTG